MPCPICKKECSYDDRKNLTMICPSFHFRMSIDFVGTHILYGHQMFFFSKNGDNSRVEISAQKALDQCRREWYASKTNWIKEGF